MRPPDFQGTTAGDDIVIDREARFAYAADRFDDIIVTFAISPESGTLTLLNRTPCGGKVPRHLTLDPSGRWLLVANQASTILPCWLAIQRRAVDGGKNFRCLSRSACSAWLA